jgi:filamentous hemagglutinin family protein
MTLPPVLRLGCIAFWQKYLAIGNRGYTNKVRLRGLNSACVSEACRRLGRLCSCSPRLLVCGQFVIKLWGKWHFRVAFAFSMSSAVASSDSTAFAQLIPDTTLGTENSTVTSISPTVDQINGGAIRGANLFHSFLEFNVGEGRTVRFTNPAGIENILTRVTGTNASNILGTLAVSGGNANLFLINPNGINFGQNASLNLGGSFVASTANSLVFADGTIFSAKAPQTTPLLTISVPIGLQFGKTPGDIRVQGTGHNLSVTPAQPTPSGLQMQPGNTLAFVGGNVFLEGGILVVPQGRVELGSVASEGLVSLKPASNGWTLEYEGVPSFGDIILSQRALVDGSGDRIPALRGRQVRSSAIQVTGRQVQLREGSQFRLINTATTKGEAVVINAGESLEIIGNTKFRPITSVFLVTRGNGDAGDIQINTGKLLLQNRGIVESSSETAGRAGNITITAKEVDIVGRHPIEIDKFSSLNTEAYSTGDAGNITITAHRVRVQSGGRIVTNTGITSNGGIAVNNAGNITIQTNSLIVSDDGARIEATVVRDVDANAFGFPAFGTATGQSGNITILAADSVMLSDTVFRSDRPSGFLVRTSGTGNAGSLWIDTRRLIVENGAIAEASTRFTGAGGGNGGKLIVNASESVELIGRSGLTGTPSILTAESRGTGKAGDLEINTSKLIVRDGAQVNVSGTGTGNAGTLRVNADSIFLNNQGKLTGETASGRGGDIQLQVRDYILMRNRGAIATSAQNNGTGGNITINSPFIVALPKENSDIIADAQLGSGGQIRITATGIYGLEFRDKLTPLSDISASSEFGVDGTVELITPEFDPSQSVTNLPENLVDSSELIANSCIGRRNQQENSFIITGTGGLPPRPGDAYTSPYPTGTVRTIPNNSTSSDTSSHSVEVNKPVLLQQFSDKFNTATETQKEDNLLVPEEKVSSTTPSSTTPTPLVEASGWVYGANGEVILTSVAPTINPHSSWSTLPKCQ